jgi:homoserine O-acetyltransferase/O-succinyltransferase
MSQLTRTLEDCSSFDSELRGRLDVEPAQIADLANTAPLASSAPICGVNQHRPKALKQYTPAEPLRLDSGVALANATIGYQTWGTLNSSGDNVIWVCHALTGTTDVAATWPALFGAGKALDPMRYFIVCANVLGGCYGSAGPLTHGHEQGCSFPEISIFDMARHQQMLAAHLGVKGVQLLLGGSMGGFQALAWAHQNAIPIAKLALIATSNRQPAQASALADMQCQAIALDPNFKAGKYSTTAQPKAGLALARQIGHLSYRCEAELNARFDRTERADGRLQVLSYLDHQGHKLANRFDANSYLRISKAMNRFALSADQLGQIASQALIISVRSDWLYPEIEQRKLAELLPNARHLAIDSDYGHDGFLLDAVKFERELAGFLER